MLHIWLLSMLLKNTHSISFCVCVKNSHFILLSSDSKHERPLNCFRCMFQNDTYFTSFYAPEKYPLLVTLTGTKMVTTEDTFWGRQLSLSLSLNCMCVCVCSVSIHGAWFKLYFETCEFVWPSKMSQWPPIILKWGSGWTPISSSCREPWWFKNVNMNKQLFDINKKVTCSCSICTADLRLSEDMLPSLSCDSICWFPHTSVCNLTTSFFCCWRSSEMTKPSGYMN